MIPRILAYIKQHNMIQSGDHVVAGVSGGADSVCMLLILDSLRESLSFDLTAVHVEHGLRGGASLRDAVFVEQLCRERQIDCRVFYEDVQGKAAAAGLSLEEAGRELRYACFTRVCRETGANKIAVAHHRDDQAETVLLHLFRGAGLRGMCGMAPVRDNIIRPLLDTGRDEIEQWLRQQGIAWRTDETNLETAYTRNKIRLRVLPLVEQEIQPRVSEHMAKTAEHLRQVQEYVTGQAGRVYEKCVREEPPCLRILLEEFRQQEPLLQTMVLQRALERLGCGLKDISAVHLESLLELAGKETGKTLSLPHRISARREYAWLILEEAGQKMDPEAEPDLAVEVSVPGTYEYRGLTWRFTLEDGKKTRGIPEKTYTKWFDYDKIEQYLKIRIRQSGDYLEINRERGRKKLKDHFIDLKLPREEREQRPLLADGSHVLWILGERISEAYKVTEQTKRLLRVEVYGGDTNDRNN